VINVKGANEMKGNEGSDPFGLSKAGHFFVDVLPYLIMGN